MGITPVEIHHLQLGRGLFGYRRSTVDRCLEEIAVSYEVVWRERADLESLLRQTLVTAERATQEQLEGARKQAEAIVGEAQSEARSIVRRARDDRERLEGEVRRVASLLRSALASLGDGPEKADGGTENEVRRLAG